MADNIDTGIVFTQNGTDVQGAADYQKTIDSRWRFIETVLEVPVKVTLPFRSAVSAANRYYDDIIIARHPVGKYPAFETSIFSPIFPNDFQVLADESTVIIRRLISANDVDAQNIDGVVRVYNLPILETYESSKGPASGGASPRGDFGVKFLDGTGQGVDVEDESSVGFSANSRHKTLVVQKHGLVSLDEAAGNNTITHNMGYPPTYLMARYYDKFSLQSKPYIEPLAYNLPMRVRSNDRQLTFQGVQSIVLAKYGYIILKDPVELAK